MLPAFQKLSFGYCQLGKDFMGGFVKNLPLLSQDKPTGMPVEQRHIQGLFQRTNLAADGRLAEIKRLSRMGEAACLSNSVKDSQLVPVHSSQGLPNKTNPAKIRAI